MLRVKPVRWLAIILLFTVLAIICAEFIPNTSELFFVRYFFGFVFISILPGYCLVNILFVKEQKLDFPEEAVLSVALSFGIAGLTGLFLGLSPIGITTNSIILSLSTIVIVLALIAFLRKMRA